MQDYILYYIILYYIILYYIILYKNKLLILFKRNKGLEKFEQQKLILKILKILELIRKSLSTYL